MFKHSKSLDHVSTGLLANPESPYKILSAISKKKPPRPWKSIETSKNWRANFNRLPQPHRHKKILYHRTGHFQSSSWKRNHCHLFWSHFKKSDIDQPRLGWKKHRLKNNHKKTSRKRKNLRNFIHPKRQTSTKAHPAKQLAKNNRFYRYENHQILHQNTNVWKNHHHPTHTIVWKSHPTKHTASWHFQAYLLRSTIHIIWNSRTLFQPKIEQRAKSWNNTVKNTLKNHYMASYLPSWHQSYLPIFYTTQAMESTIIEAKAPC